MQPSNLPLSRWPRAIIHVDMNSFFAAIEQLDQPELNGQPVAITNGAQGTCIITCSYEARAYGVKTGMRLVDAYKLCPYLIQIASRPERYAEVSQKIMSALEVITPDIEIFSVDEAFLDITHCQRLHGTPEQIGWMVKKIVFNASGLRCSIGISGDKTTAKFAAKLQKPNGFTVIPPWEAKARLRDIPVTELCGIAEGIGNFLANYGVYTCGDVEKLPIGVLAKRFGNIGRRIWLMCQGLDPEPVKTQVADPKSMGHGKVMPPNTRDIQTILIYLRHMTEKLAARLRCHNMQAKTFFVGLKTYDQGWLSDKARAAIPTNDGDVIYKLGKDILAYHWSGHTVRQIQVTALDPQPAEMQFDLWQSTIANMHRHKINSIVDNINARYGEFAIMPALLLHRSAMNNVIAPAWRPYGHRQTI